MKSIELKQIVEKIKADKDVTDEDIATAIGRNRSYISRKLNEEEVVVARKLVKKFKDAYPGYFIDSNNGNKIKSLGSIELVADTKEEVLTMLKMSLAANIEHAAANKENALASKDNSQSLHELVKILRLKLNSQNNAKASPASPEKNKQPHDRRGRMPLNGGKQGTRLIRKGKAPQKGKAV